MIIRIIGAILILSGCCATGVLLSSNHRKAEIALQQLSIALEHFEYELQYRQASLSALLRTVATEKGAIHDFFNTLSTELENQIEPDAACCVAAALGKSKGIPELVEPLLLSLGRSIGRFDIESQAKELSSVRKECELLLSKHINNQDNRIRCYQTLAVCTGFALIIVLI